MSADVSPEFMHHDAAGNSVPLFWYGSLEGLPGGVAEAIERGAGDLGAGWAPGYQGRGLSGVVLRAMKEVAAGRPGNL